MISKEMFCKALRMIVEQEEINRRFAEALQLVGNGHYVFGTPNKYYDALLEVLKETVGDKYDYISWWLYDGGDRIVSWEENGQTVSVNLTDVNALYCYLAEQSVE